MEGTWMWNAIICDDEPEMRLHIQGMLQRFSGEYGEAFNVTQCDCANALLCQLRPNTDLVFLDIGMEGMNGMEAAQIIRQRNCDVCLIFVTSMVQYAFEGYQVHAYGFLKKPLKYAQFRLQMSDTMRMLRERRSQRVTLKIGHENYMLFPEMLVYAEVRNHNVELHLKKETLTCYTSIAELEESLSGFGFFRCHKSYLVNLRRIRKVSGYDILLDNGETIPLSKRRRKELMDELARCLGGDL